MLPKGDIFSMAGLARAMCFCLLYYYCYDYYTITMMIIMTSMIIIIIIIIMIIIVIIIIIIIYENNIIWSLGLLLLLPGPVKIHQRGVQWKQGVVIYVMLYTVVLHDTTQIHCTPPPTAPPCDGYPTRLSGSRRRSPRPRPRLSLRRDNNVIGIIYIYIYIYTYIHTYIHTYIYIYICYF